ncbi:MAG: hypothetical protein IKZ82_10745 [Clostridia bacterium]|nr:hypothetical protein [Clostridia bacterium]
MKRTLRGILACFLALMPVLPAFSGAMAETARELPLSEHIGEVRSGVYEDVRVNGAAAYCGTSAIRNGRTFRAADV